MGGVSGRPTREAGGSDPFEILLVVATVESILVHGTAAPFAGGRKNVGLGRSVTSVRVSSLANERAGDSGCSLGSEEGNVVGVRQAHAPPTTPLMRMAGRGHVLRSVQRPVHADRHYTLPSQDVGGGAVEVVSRSGKPAQAGGTDTGVISNGRCAARRASPLSQERQR